MVFTSTLFLFLFLPLFLAVYHLLPPERRTLWILVASYAFYGWWRLDFLALFAGTTLFTWLAGRAVTRWQTPAPGRARAALTVGVVGNLATLAYFKYADFGIDSLNTLLAALGGGPLPLWNVVLPIGISFYVFQSVSYLVDVARRDAPGDRSFVDVAAYIALFPQLIAGPIVRFKLIAGQLERPGGSLDDLGAGAWRFMVGFCKKVLIADTIAPLADASFALTAPSAGDAWLGALAYAAQLFFDFSGYSDMAIGLGRMMGLRFLENFDRPYLAATIGEFWRRWHISLSRWLRDYLYIPLGGNRRGQRRTYLNLMTVMVLGGLWHGAAWTFALWGLWHGVLLASERFLTERGAGFALPRPLATLRTFGLVLVGWVLFRSATLADAGAMLTGMIGQRGFGISAELAWQLRASSLTALAAAALIVLVPPLWRALRGRGGAVTAGAAAPFGSAAPSPLATLALTPFVVLGLLRVIAESFSPFLYFRF